MTRTMVWLKANILTHTHTHTRDDRRRTDPVAFIVTLCDTDLTQTCFRISLYTPCRIVVVVVCEMATRAILEQRRTVATWTGVLRDDSFVLTFAANLCVGPNKPPSMSQPFFLALALFKNRPVWISGAISHSWLWIGASLVNNTAISRLRHVYRTNHYKKTTTKKNDDEREHPSIHPPLLL